MTIHARNIAAAALMALLGACRQPQNAAENPVASADSLRGVISVRGTSFEKQLVLTTRNDVRVTAAASDSAMLTAVAGVEILARGAQTPSGFLVKDFTVVAVDGQPVVEGILGRRNGQLVLETRTASLVLANPPQRLLSLVGARVWVGGPIDKGPNTFGVITPAGAR